LKPRAETILTIDAVQSGLGGASCGPGTLPAYLVLPGEYRFTFWLRPLGSHMEPADLFHAALPAE